MAKKIFITNIKIAVLAEDNDEACDAMSAALTENLMRNEGILDWQYLKGYGDFTVKDFNSDTYEEGEAF